MTSDRNPATGDFLGAYVDLMMRVWREPETADKLLADPRGTAVEAGLPVDDGAEVVLDRTSPAGEALFTEAQLTSDWHGEPGRHILHVPSTPLIDTAELDERDLDGISAGTANVNVVIACMIA